MKFKVSLVTFRPHGSHLRAPWRLLEDAAASADVLCSPVTAGPGG